MWQTRLKMSKPQKRRITTMDQITELWNLPWGGNVATFMLMALYTYKVWIDNKFK